MIKVKAFYGCRNEGDGSPYLKWFLTQKEATDWEQEEPEDSFGADCTGSVETFEGSDIHREAISNK